MQNLQNLEEVRRNLTQLVYWASVVDADVLASQVRKNIQRLGQFREVIQAKDIACVAVPTEKLIADVPKAVPPVTVREPQKFEIPRAPGPSRKVPASTSYNAERYVPYRVLWAKVIIRAAYDYALWRDSKESRLRKFAQDAERWIFESSDLELSFENICFAFDFPVEKIRKRTRALTKQDVKKLEFRERHGRVDVIGEAIGGND